jgi:hypothetical protein
MSRIIALYESVLQCTSLHLLRDFIWANDRAPKPAGHFFENFLKLFLPDLERTGKDRTPYQKYSTYEQQIPSRRSFIHHHIRA